MVIKNSRAQRRHDNARMLERAKRKFYYWNDENEDREHLHKILRQVRDNLAICSCYMCGNQRHNDWQNNKEMLTMQERKHITDIEEGLEEYYEELL